jgi:hypothetical protein
MHHVSRGEKDAIIGHREDSAAGISAVSTGGVESDNRNGPREVF